MSAVIRPSNPARRKQGKKNKRGRNRVEVQSRFALERMEPRVLLSTTPLVVTQFAADASGFTAHFNQPIDSTVLNLYDTETGTLGPADVTVVGASAGSVKGTLTVDNDTLRFIKTGGVLSPDIYTVTMRGASNGVKGVSGDLLDGDNDGTAGDNYVHAFTMNPVAGVTVGIADFARGPGQVIQVPAPANGIPISISNGSGVTSVDLTLTYDFTLLTITAVTAGSALPAGSVVQSDLTEAGTVTLHVTSPTPMTAGPLELVRLVSQVPHTATYGDTGVLDIVDLSVNHGSLAATADDGVEVAAFFGEATGNGSYSSLDGSRILRVVVGLDSGYSAYPFVDPVLLTDITGNGIISSLDGTRILQEVVGLDRAEIESITASILAHLVLDSGPSAVDHVTKDPSISGTVTDDGTITNFKAKVDNGAFVNVTGDLTNGSFSFSRTRLEQILGGPLSDGAHTLTFQATDNTANVSTNSTFSFTLDTTLPTIASLSLSAGSDTGTAGDNITSATQVQLVGSAEFGSTLTLNGQAVLAGAGGVFQLPGVTLANGTNSFTLTATDLAGNISQQNLTVTKQGSVTADVALQWNQITLDSIRLLVTDPPIATRILAMVSLAEYDALAAIEGTPAYLVHQSVAGPVSVDVAVAKAAYTVLYALYPSFRASYDTALNTLLATIADGAAKTNALALGLAIGNGVLAVRANDGSDEFVDYPGSIDIGQWRPTAPMFDDASEPQWGDVTPFALSSGDEFRPAPPPTLDSALYAQDVNEIKSLGVATGSTRTADQTQIAQFWADGKGSYTPPGHWNLIAQQVALSKGNSLSSNIRLFAELNVALADAAIAAWDAKYEFGLWRPIDAIHFADQDPNSATVADANWTPLLITPSFPEYLSGHSTFSMAAAGILAATFGNNTAFSIGSFTLPGVTRNFTSFTQAAQEAGRSRIYGGIHYEFTNQTSQVVGAEIATAVLTRFQLSQDITPPVIVGNSSPAVTNANLNLTGQIIDNLSGVAQAKYKVDDGFFQALTLDSQGHFSITTPFILNGSTDGLHTISISAKDAAANDAPLFVRSFTLDTVAPVITLNSIADNSSISATSRLTGAANPTGSTLTSLLYKFDNGSTRSVSFNNTTGAFDESLFIGNLSVGSHTLTLTARDAAGNVTTLVRNVTLNSATPFIVASMTPDESTSDVGVTFRPQVVFSRSVNAASLTDSSFYATGSDGQKIAATIVTATDGSFAWLFFTNPLPGGATITVHLDGALITAASDQQLLDGNGDGTPGGNFTRSFTTVSTASVAGTTLVGKVVDPGPDLQPMTFDDIRRGPDGIIHTADDVFLNPIVHAKVYILGQESNFVFTDANGDFQLSNVPTGNVKIAIDGRTATNAPAGIFFPEMVVDANMLAGFVNTIMGSMTMDNNVQGLANLDRKEVYLPRLQSNILQNVSNTQNTVVSPDAVSSPDLTDQERQALSLTVVPNSAIGENGQLLTNIQIGVSTVPEELVQDMLPPGVLQHTFDITIQAPGVATFAQPLQISFPNVFNAAPGEKLFVLSFDHTTGRLVINGTATVSADGLSVISDPDSGIKAPGWHGLTPPGPNGRKDKPKGGGGPGGGPGGGGPGGGGPGGGTGTQDPDDPDDPVVVAPDPFTDGIEDQFFVDDTGNGVLTFRNDADPIDPNSDPAESGNAEATPLIIEIDVDGPADEFLIGLFSQSFALLPGEEWTIPYEVIPLIPTINDPGTDPLDRLYGVSVHVIGYASDDPSTLLIDETFYVYRYLDVRDSVHDDGVVEMADTANDGSGGILRNRGVEFHTSASALPTIDASASTDFSFEPFFEEFFFDPSSTADDISTVALIIDPDGNTAGTLDLMGDGTLQEWFVDQAAFLTTLADLASGTLAGASAAERLLIDTLPERQAVVNAVIAGAEALLSSFSDGWIRVLATTTTSVDIDVFDTGHARGSVANVNVLGNSFLVDNASNGGVVALIAAQASFNQAEQAFRLSEAMNEQSFGAIDMYIDRYFGFLDLGALGIGALQNALAKTFAHEFGHTAGLNHTSDDFTGAAGNIRIADPNANNDVMAQGIDTGGVLSFIVTTNALDIGLGLDWTVADGQQALGYFAQYIAAGGNFDAAGQAYDAVGGDDPNTGAGLPINDGAVGIVSLPSGEIAASTDFGIVSVDGAGGVVSTRNFKLVNLGDQPLTINSFGFSPDSSSAFHVTAIAGGTLLAPLATAAFSVTFDPTVSGEQDATLVIQSDGIVPIRNFSISGSGLSPFGDITISAPNNNVGGRQVGLVANVTPNFATVKNAGASPLTITNVIVSKGVGEYAVTALPPGFGPGNPIVLAPGAQFSFGLSFDPNTTGIRAGEIEIHSNDPDMPILRFAVTGTGLADIGTALDWGHDFVLMEVGSLAPQRFRSDFNGDINTFLPANTPYTLSVFDPESGLVWKSYGVSADDGETTDLGLPFFAASTAPDTNNDGLPDDVNFIIGPGPLFDFGTAASPLSPGYTRITSSTAYDALQGYGWLPGGVINQSDFPVAGITNELTRDFNETTNATFAVNLPNGIYDVTLKVGDHFSRSQQLVELEGDLRGNISTLEAQYITTTYRVIISDGQLTLHLSSPGGAVINALEVTLVQAGNFASPGPTADATGRFAFAIENLDNGFVMRGTRDLPDGGVLCPEGITFAASTNYRQWVLNIDTLERGFSDFTTPASGQTFDMPDIIMGVTQGTDTDGDGLDSVAEFILGTNAKKKDTDGDGASDKAEVQAGTNPIDGRPAITGVLAAVALQGEAKAVSAEQASGVNIPTVAVATGSYGVAFVDITSFDHPLVMREVNLAGDSTDVAFDGDLGIAAVASNAGGLNFVGLDGAVRNIAINPSAVEMIDGFAYANNGGDLISFDALTGDVLQTLTISFAPIVAMSHEGSHLFTIDSGNLLRAFEVSSGTMIARGTLGLPSGATKMFVGGGVAFIGAEASFTGGYMTVDVSNLNTLSLLSGIDNTAIPGKAIALNGSGLGVTVGSLAFVGGTQNLITVVSTTDPTNTGAFITQFTLAADPFDVAIAAGFAFVADGTGGLVVVNYKAADNLGVAPAITLNALVTDLDPGTPGIQIQEGRVFQVVPTVSDDVQVRNVDLMVNGVIVHSDIAFPWDLFVSTPSIASAGTTLTVRAVATDTGGNSTTSAPLTFIVVPDTFAPFVLNTKPSNAAKPFFVPSIDVRFSEQIQEGLLNLSGLHLMFLGADLHVGGGDDVDINIDSLTIRERGTLLSIVPAVELTAGAYRLTIDTAVISDIAGNHISAPFVLDFTIRPASDVHALSGVPKIFQAPSANVGQEIAIGYPGADSGLRLVFQTIDGNGTQGLVQVAPSHLDAPTGQAFFIVPANANTGDIDTTHIGQLNYSTFPLWNVLNGSVDLLGQPLAGSAFIDLAPGNGLYVEMGGSSSDAGRLESKTNFTLDPGTYELRFDLAPPETGTVLSKTVTVSLGSLFSESFVLNSTTTTSFTSIVRTITVAAPAAARLAFEQTGNDNIGILVDDVKLTNVGTGQVLIQDNFDFNFVDGALPLQIVPTLIDVDQGAGDAYHNGGLRLRGSGFIEGGSTISFGAQTVIDVSPASGPNIGFFFAQENDGMDLTVPVDVPFGPIRVTTAGGTSAAFNLSFSQIAKNAPVSFSGVTAVAASGTPANALLPSANPGQAIVVVGTGLDYTTDVVFQLLDSNGTPYERVVRPVAVNAGGTEAVVIVPVDNGLTGIVGIVGDQLNTQAALQIVPVLTNVILGSIAGDGSSANFTLRGAGLVEGNNSTYTFGTVSVVDVNAGTGPNVFFGVSFDNDSVNNVIVPMSGAAWGAVTVTTAGGTSAPFSRTFTSITSTALSGTPANAGQASANPGQMVTLNGTGLGLSTEIVGSYIDSNGTLVTQQFNPVYVNEAGTQAQWIVPLVYSGAQTVRVMGSTGAVLLQIVPVVTSLDVSSASAVTIRGRGFVEANNTAYSFGGVSVVDTNAGTGPNVFGGVAFDNDSVNNIILPVDGPGTFTVTTIGGTSAPLAWNAISSGLQANLVDVAYNGAANEILVASSGTALIYRINPATGAVIGTFGIPVQNSNNLGLQILPVGMTLAGTAVPAGSLLVSNGAPSPDRIVAVNPTTGVTIATLTLPVPDQNIDMVAGVYHAASGHLFVVDDNPNEIVEIDPATGLVLGRTATPFDINFGGLAVHPVTGNLWVGSSQVGVLAEMTVTAGNPSTLTPVQTFDLAPFGIDANEVSGLAFRDANTLLVNSLRGVVYVVSLTGAAAPAAPALTSITALAGNGTPASAAASANVRQVIELVGTNFRLGDLQVQFHTRDNSGNTGTTVVGPLAVSGDGTRAQVLVPDQAETGAVQVVGGAGSVLLQIVPTLTSVSGRPGLENSTFNLNGSGFMEGASTIRIGATDVIDSFTNLAELDVFGGQNDAYQLTSPLAVEGPIRVTTAGGFDQISGPVFGLPAYVDLIGLQAVAGDGVPANVGAASANTGQIIRLLGFGFNNSTLVQFDGIDDQGGTGILTRTGTAGSNGTTLDVEVPLLARTGVVRVVGDATTLSLQIVPVIRAVGGTIGAGNTILLEGSGLIQNGLTVRIDGQLVAGVLDVRAITDRGRDQQVVALTVPAGIGAGVVQVQTAGGSATWRPAATIAALADLTPGAEVGNTLATAQALGLGANQQITVHQAIAVGNDVDLYAFTAGAGDHLDLTATLLAPGNSLTDLRLFDAAGVQLAVDVTSGAGSTPRIQYYVTVAGTYYVGVSGHSNLNYNAVDGTGSVAGGTGTYNLVVRRADGVTTSLTGITATAGSGTAANTAVASANTGQTITLTGSGFSSADRVIFEYVESGGAQFGETGPITPSTVAVDGTSLTVVVPVNATSGMVRLAREQAGRFLQIVPTLTDVDQGAGDTYHGGGLRLRGTAFVEAGTAVNFGGIPVPDQTQGFGANIGGFFVQENDGMDATVPTGMAFGPITVTTLGGTSTAFNLTFTQIAKNAPVSFSGVTAVAASGTPANALLPSANPGQAIVVVGTGLDYTTDVVFQLLDSNGTPYERVVRPVAVNAGGTEAVVIVPVDNGLTGIVGIVGDQLNTQAALQIVPVLTNVILGSIAGDGSSANFTLRGAGLVEGNNSTYTFGTVSVVDVNAGTGPNVFFGVSFDNDSVNNVIVPMSGAAWGAVTVTTAGGTSAPFSRTFTSITSTALSGTPANAGQASANPGQMVTLNGTGLGLSTEIVGSYIDSNGTLVTQQFNPVYVNEAGTQAQWIVPLVYSGAQTVRVMGSTGAVLLQIVPVVTSLDVSSASAVTIRGRGFVEANNSAYSFSGVSVVDTNAGTGPNVFTGVAFDNDSVNNIILPVDGPGTFTVTTIGGTSAPLAWNAISSGLQANLVDVAYNGAANEILVASSGTALIYRINPATGAVIGTFGIPVANSNNLGLQILPVGMTLAGTVVPAGSLLVSNGAPSPDRIVAVNPTTGVTIATLTLPVPDQNIDMVAGVYHAASGHLFVVDDSPNEIVEIDPATGLVLGRTATPFDINFGGLAVHPVTGNLWVGSSQVGVLAEMTVTSGSPSTLTQVQTFDLSPFGIDVNEVSGLAFRDANTLLVNSLRGVVYLVSLTGAAAPAAPALTSITALAGNGTPASAAASANVRQVIELVGTNFRLGDLQVQFHTRDNSGNTGTTVVGPLAVSGDGTRAQVLVPDQAETGAVQVVGGAGSVLLQIVPTLTSVSGRPGLENSTFNLNGSGFMEGASTIRIGATDVIDSFTNLAELDVFGGQNDAYQLTSPLAVEGPIRVTTAGGFDQISGPVFGLPAYVDLIGLQAVAGDGVPGNVGAASANTGQIIRLLGFGFNSSTLVQFDGIDDQGGTGLLTRTGTAGSNGTTLDVEVPLLARTGVVRVVGDATTLSLQIVPVIRAVGGTIGAGNTILLEGSGLIQNGLTVRIDGQLVAGVLDVRAITDRGRDQQVVALTVPAGIGAGVVQVQTAGGSATWRPAATIAALADLTPGAEVGNTLVTAEALGLGANQQITVHQAIAVATDVDLYAFTAGVGDHLDLTATLLAPGNSLTDLRLFNAAGVQLAVDVTSGAGSTPRIQYYVTVAGTYYVGVSGHSNLNYNAVDGTGATAGGTGTYDLVVRRADGVPTSLTGITATAGSGTAANTAVASANTGQTITLTGSGFTSADRVIFEYVESGGAQLGETGPITPTVAVDGTSLTVVVPVNATSGMVRLSREQAGRFLQIVPTLTDVDQGAGDTYHGGGLRLRGTAFVEAGTAVNFGGIPVPDQTQGFGANIGGFFVQENDGMDATVPAGMAFGPITVTTLGGTSAAFNLTFTGIAAGTTATLGTPANPGLPSANPGQIITLNGSGFDTTTDVVFPTIDSGGTRSERIVRPQTVAADGLSMTVAIPQDAAVTGTIGIVGDKLNTQAQLQIVPLLVNVDMTSVASDGSSANFTLRGVGFVEGNNSTYTFGTVSVVDVSAGTGPNVFAGFLFDNDAVNNVIVPLSAAAWGAVTVTTLGGTSAPFTRGFTSITSVALTGTPAVPGQASANSGQVITLNGTGLSTATDIVAQYIDSNGTPVTQLFNPSSVNGPGTQAQWTVPQVFNGVNVVRIVGSTAGILLQIVPVVTSVDVSSTNLVTLRGSGFVEANNTAYAFGGINIVDTSAGTGPNVFGGVAFDNDSVNNIALPVSGPGSFTVTTAGGTSAPLVWNVISAGIAPTVVDVAYNGAANELLVGSSGTGLIHRINPATGAQIGSFTIPLQNSNSLGLDITPVAISLHDTLSNTDVAIPAGSLIVFNGAPVPDRIIAMNPTTGTILATLNVAVNFDIVGGAVTGTGRVLVLDPNSNSIREINPLTGVEIVAGGFAAGMDINFGDIAVHPGTGNIWIASSQTTTLREYTALGVFVRSIDVTPQGVDVGELSGLAFRPNGGDFDLLASSTRSVIYVLPDPMVSVPANVVGSAGSTITVPVNIDNANGVLTASFRLAYDTDLLDVDAGGVHPGSLTTGGSLVSTVDDPAGTIDIWLTLNSPLGPGAGSLVVIDYQIAPAAVGTAALDLQNVSLNNGALILSTEPVVGADSTDGMIAIHPALRSSSQELQLSFRPDMLNSAPDNFHDDGIWVDDFDAGESFPGSHPLRRKDLNHPKRPLIPVAVADKVRSSRSIQWDRQIPDKAIRRALLEDWLILK